MKELPKISDCIDKSIHNLINILISRVHEAVAEGKFHVNVRIDSAMPTGDILKKISNTFADNGYSFGWTGNDQYFTIAISWTMYGITKEELDG